DAQSPDRGRRQPVMCEQHASPGWVRLVHDGDLGGADFTGMQRPKRRRMVSSLLRDTDHGQDHDDDEDRDLDHDLDHRDRYRHHRDGRSSLYYYDSDEYEWAPNGSG
ncbi:unnamed protein product, partial [Laminaria digitata]